MVFWYPVDELTLLVAVIHHRFFDEAVTVDFFLGRTFIFNVFTPDYPREAAPRIDRLIDRPMQSHAGRGWWVGYEATTADDMARAIGEALPVYLARPSIGDAVRSLAWHREAWERASEVVAAMRPPAQDPYAKIHPPRSGPPLAWRAATDAVLARRNELEAYGRSGRRQLALDAWRMWLTGHPPLAEQ